MIKHDSGEVNELEDELQEHDMNQDEKEYLNMTVAERCVRKQPRYASVVSASLASINFKQFQTKKVTSTQNSTQNHQNHQNSTKFSRENIKSVAKVVVFAVHDLVLLLQKRSDNRYINSENKSNVEDEGKLGIHDTVEEQLVRAALCDHNVVKNLISIAKVEEMGGAIRKKCLEPMKILDKLDSRSSFEVQQSKIEIESLEEKINKCRVKGDRVSGLKNKVKLEK
jgi:hypothetical protein